MAVAGQPIEAVLTLNATNFHTGISEATSAVNNFTKSIDVIKKDSSRIGTAIGQLEDGLIRGKDAINEFNATVGKTTNFNNFAQAINRIANALKILSGSEIDAVQSTELINNMFRAFKDSLNGAEIRVKGVSSSLSQLSAQESQAGAKQQELTTKINASKMSLVNLDSTLRKSINDITQYTSATNRATASTQRQATANRTATASSNQFASATNRLGRALSSLKMMGTMVGSMLAYNFVHHLAQATNETIQSKSEMEGYFKMLGYGQGEIQRFNSALDQTVARFQRVNKYSLGETISSIGVEFNLTTDEMIKAMDVTSMITSEYLRAGRNANEASLAVKDVLQGQFQRLSRETGVKGEQLKEAGWNGDVNDVNSLLDALRKVAEDRNWDVFAEKANSLNDIVTILQNRFGEWSADMVNIVQPSIVNAFNAMMMVGGALGDVLSGAWEWINGDGLVNQAVRWTAIATAIGTVTTALVSYRTGANLAQFAQMGLRGSIMATIFGLKAEEVATHGSTNALIAKITSLKAEQVAEMGSARAIATKLLGLDAELVKNNGLKGAIMSTVLARKLEEAEMQGATVAQKAKIATDHMEEVSNMGTLRTIMAKIAGVNMETFAEKGLIVALAERVSASLPYVSALEAEKVAEMSTAEAGLFLTASLAPLIAILAGLAVGLYALIKPLQDASEAMGKFNNILNNGKDIVANHRKSYESLNSSYNKANDELNNLTKGTNEYIRKEQEVKALHDDVKTANENVINSYKAYQRTVSANAKYEEASTNIRIHAQTRLKDAYIKAGISSAKASELASHELREANEGAEQLRKTLQMLKYEADRSSAKQESIIGKLDAYGISDEQIEKYGENLANAQDKISEGMEAFMTSDDLMERVKGWFTIQQGRLEEWWTEFNALFEIRDWDGMRDSMFERLNYLLTGFGAFDWITPLKKAIGEKGLVGVIMDALFGEGDSDGALDIIWSWADSMILTPIADWLNWFMQDPFTNLDVAMDDWSLKLGKFLFGKDSSSLRDITKNWFDNNVSKPIVDWLNWFFQDPLSHFDNVMDDWSLIVGKLIFGKDSGSLRDMTDKWFDDNIKNPIVNWWNGFSSLEWLSSLTNIDILGKLFDLIFPETVSASDGSSDHPSFMEDLSAIIGFDIQAWVDSFMADPMGTLGIDLSGLDIFGSLLNFLFGTGDNTDFSWAMEYITNNIITPLSETWNMFMADPLSYLGGAMAGLGGIGSLLTMLLPSDGGVGIWEWANTNLIQPLGNALYQGIISIPLVSDILALFGLVNGENSGSGQKGRDLGESFKTAIEDKIRSIPILGDILQILGLIPQANPTASSNGQTVGSSVKQGLQNGISGIANIISTEMGNVVNAISQWAGQAYAVAHDIGSQILNGIKNALDMHSPSIISRELINNEFGTYIPEAITSNGDLAYQSAMYYGQQIRDGISSVNTDSLSMDTAVANYETDAQNIAMSSQMMGTETSTAFNDMSLAVNTTTAMMSSNVGTTYSQMQQKQTSSLQSMKMQNQTAYQEMYLKSHQSLVQMRDSTSNITSQMISAWTHMKVQLVATANQLRSESTSHFNTLSNTIGDFYRKIQNPSNWGAGTGSSTPVRSRRNTTAGRSFARGMRTRTSLHGAGSSSTYSGSKYMTVASLKKRLCPDGSCGNIFDGFNSTDKVNVEEFLASITGEHGFGGWSGWDTTHYNYIKNTSDQWSMKSPVIQVMGGIPTNANFKVGDFENGTPSISFDSFKSMAESIFSPNGGIPYKHYMDSSWKGSWLGAIQSGACNCSDGAEAIIAFASACGFGGGQKVHGYWGNEGHFWAVINGEVFDTTAMQKGYGWRSPSVHGYGTKVRTTVSSGDAPSNGNRTVNLTVNINEPVYGVDDLENHIVEASKRAMREEFNDPYTVTL